MREILFRGKTEDGEWEYGYPYEIYRNCHTRKVIARPPDAFGKGKYTEVIDETLSQFTGCTDKNGVNIFEGDIIQVDFQQEYIGIKPRPSYIGVVECKNGAFGIYEKGKGTQYFFQHGLIKTVIGNIHDNPELLGGADNV